jgi:hypothetical protein
MRARPSGVPAARVELLTFDSPRPGRYARPHLSRTLVYVAGIVLASGVLIAKLVFFLLRLREPQPLP